MSGLKGKRVALAASRRTDELSELVRKRGGIPIVYSIQSTVMLEMEQVMPDLQRLTEEPPDWIILTTGIGTQALLDHARKMGLFEKVMEVLRTSHIAIRGYKTHRILKTYGIVPVVRDEKGTVDDLIHCLRAINLAGCRVVVQLYGEKAPRLEAFLKDKGAICDEILPYRHVPPDEEVVVSLIEAICQRKVDAVAFTSAIQVRNLFDVARKQERAAFVQDAFARDVLAVAVGTVTFETLKSSGVSRVIKPERERMGAMIMELDRHFSM